MTPIEQQIAAAECEGFTDITFYRDENQYDGMHPTLGWQVIPNYAQDANAMARLRGLLSDDEWMTFIIILTNSNIYTYTDNPVILVRKAMQSPLPKQLEAFLKAKGLWV